MEFVEVLNFMRMGEKITRPIFAKGFYFSLENFCDYKGTFITQEDIDAGDWELVNDKRS